MAERHDPTGSSGSDVHGRTAESEVGVHTIRAVEALGTGVRTTLRRNATAYGFSVTITAAFGLVQESQRHTSPFALRIMLFAAGVAGAFLVVDVVASHWFRPLPGNPSEREVEIGGAIDAVAVLAAVGAGVGIARIPDVAAWPTTAFGVTVVFLVVSGVNVLVAHYIARRDARQAERP